MIPSEEYAITLRRILMNLIRDITAIENELSGPDQPIEQMREPLKKECRKLHAMRAGVLSALDNSK
jgi:hypothetical protein